LRSSVLLYARADDLVRRAQDRARRWAEELLGEALSPEEQADLGVHLYAASPPGTGAPADLWPWERAWFQRRLPPAPAPLLLGGAGAGREAAALTQLGYRVDAFEPVPALQPRCAAAVGPEGEALVGTYQDLAHAVLTGQPGPLGRFAGRKYAAVILGWGSFTHVLEERERHETLVACARLAPTGPILASFWMRGDHAATGAVVSPARQVGRLIARLRGSVASTARHAFGTWCGFAHAFSREEIESLAASIDRRAQWEAEPGTTYPHVTLVSAHETPPTSATAATPG
jgi:hypothetical protein